MGEKMNEAEFIVRRIIKEANAWSLAELESKQDAPTGTSRYYLNRRAAQVDLINHIIKTFTDGEPSESRND
jgi:hypothetical protein